MPPCHGFAAHSRGHVCWSTMRQKCNTVLSHAESSQIFSLLRMTPCPCAKLLFDFGKKKGKKDCNARIRQNTPCRSHSASQRTPAIENPLSPYWHTVEQTRLRGTQQ